MDRLSGPAPHILLTVNLSQKIVQQRVPPDSLFPREWFRKSIYKETLNVDIHVARPITPTSAVPACASLRGSAANGRHMERDLWIETSICARRTTLSNFQRDMALEKKDRRGFEV